MIKPNLYTLADKAGVYGLHRFKDGMQTLCKQHTCGDWQTVRPATVREIEYFEAHGAKVVPEVVVKDAAKE